MVAKKDFHAAKHPEVEAVPNHHLIKALKDSYEGEWLLGVVMVATKDFHAAKHPEVEAVPNLHVIKALQVGN